MKTKPKIAILKNYEVSHPFLKSFKKSLELDAIDKTMMSNIQDMIVSLKNKEVDYIAIPSRLSYTNDVSPICIDVILRNYGDSINEIYTGIDKKHCFKNSKASKDTPYYFGGKKYKKVKPSLDETKNNYLEFKIFKRNEYKTNPLLKVFLAFFTRKNLNIVIKLINIISMGFVIAYFVLLAISRNDNLKLLGEFIPLVAIFLQIFADFCGFEKLAENSLVTGYWLYYSFEDTYELGNYVPKGFTTRLLHIKQKGGEVSMSCSFSGSDTLFWSYDNLTFDYNPKSYICNGSYSYNSNIINANGRRPEGACIFKGKADKIAKIPYMDGWFSGRGTMINGRVKYIRIKKDDYDILKHSFPDRSTTFSHSTIVVGIFGDAGSNTDYAFTKEYEGLDIFKGNRVVKKYYSSFSEIYYDLYAKKLNYALLPIFNKELISMNYESGKKAIQKQFKNFEFNNELDREIKIDYVYCSKKSNYKINSKTRFLSNVEALKQCGFDLKKDNIQIYSSTSEAARSAMLGETKPDDLVICNLMAAKIYNLYVLDTKPKLFLEEGKENITKFRLYSNKQKNEK